MKEILLTQGKVALVDDEDYKELSKVKWYVKKYGKTSYAARNTPRKDGKQMTIRMHRVILPPPVGKEIDHINGDGLDNRRENLRIVSHRENGQNRHERKTSKYPGVSWHKSRNKWSAQIRISGKLKYLGLFDDEWDAYKTYMKACVDLL